MRYLRGEWRGLENDLISRQAAIDAAIEATDDWDGKIKYDRSGWNKVIKDLPSAQKKGYTKADYIMALHKEYGCSLTRAEEAH